MKENISINCLAYQLSQARKKVMKWYETYLKNLGISISYIYVMEVINDNGPSSLTFIAHQLELEKATVSNLLVRMERDDIIIRLSEKGRKAYEIKLTAKGQSILAEALKGLKSSDEQLNQLLGGKLEEVKNSIKVINSKI